MGRYEFTLRVMSPEDDNDIDLDTFQEIVAAREPHDDDDGAILRWLGSFTSEAEDTVNALLPEHWYAKVDGGKLVE